MTDLFEVTENGLRVASLSEAKEKFDDLNKEIFGSDIDLNAHTPQNQIAGINAQIWYEVGEQIFKAALYGSSIDHAPGKFLDAFGTLLDIPRRRSTHTVVEATLFGKSGTIVDAGSLIQNSQGDQFRLEQQVTLSENGVIGKFVALNPGPIVAPAGTINEIVSAENSNWESVNNKKDGFVGQNEESDTEYRSNLKSMTALASVSTISSLNSIFRNIGATKINILENSTSSPKSISNIIIPGHSLFLIADGGSSLDLTRAYEIRRPLGVKTRSAVSANKEWNVSDTTKINAGSFKYNGQDFTGVNIGPASSISSLVTRLNSLPTGRPDFLAAGNTLMAMYDWTPKSKGFEQIYGNESEREVKMGLEVVRAEIMKGGNFIRIIFNQQVDTYIIAFNLDLTTESPNNIPNFYDQTKLEANGDVLYVNSSVDFPSDIISAVCNFSMSPECIRREVHFQDLNLTVLDPPGQNDAPISPHLSVVPYNTSAKVYASAFGSITKWQYIRFDGVEYIDKNADGSRKWKDETSTYNQFEKNYSSFTTNRSGCFIYMKAINGSEESDEVDFEFSTSNIKPQLNGNCIADGNDIEIPMNSMLHHYGRVDTNGISWWNVTANGSNIPVIEQRNCDNNIFLRLSPEIPVGATISVSYTDSRGNAIESNYGEAPSFTISSSNIDNITKNGLPSRPREFDAATSGKNVNLYWQGNHTGGNSIDAFEYSMSYDNGSTWEDWVQVSHTTTTATIEPDVVGRIPNRIKVRASNPNTRIVKSLGLDGTETLTPITRPIEKRLKINIELTNLESLVGDVLNQIKRLVVARVNEYSLGETIWVNDLLAVAELIENVRILSLTATHDGSSVNDVDQEGFIRWIIEEKDIVFS